MENNVKHPFLGVQNCYCTSKRLISQLLPPLANLFTTPILFIVGFKGLFQVIAKKISVLRIVFVFDIIKFHVAMQGVTKMALDDDRTICLDCWMPKLQIPRNIYESGKSLNT